MIIYIFLNSLKNWKLNDKVIKVYFEVENIRSSSILVQFILTGHQNYAQIQV